MIANPKNLTEQLLNLSERVATEMRVLNRTKISTINGQVPDANGNVEVAAGGSGDAIPKTGDRGALAGYNTCRFITDIEEAVEVTIDENSPDDMVIEAYANGVTLNFVGSNNLVAYVKNIFLYGDPSLVAVNFGDRVFVDTFFKIYENDLGLSAMNQIVVANYVYDEGSGILPLTFVSNKVIA